MSKSILDKISEGSATITQDSQTMIQKAKQLRMSSMESVHKMDHILEFNCSPDGGKANREQKTKTQQNKKNNNKITCTKTTNNKNKETTR